MKNFLAGVTIFAAGILIGYYLSQDASTGSTSTDRHLLDSISYANKKLMEDLVQLRDEYRVDTTEFSNEVEHRDSIIMAQYNDTKRLRNKPSVVKVIKENPEVDTLVIKMEQSIDTLQHQVAAYAVQLSEERSNFTDQLNSQQKIIDGQKTVVDHIVQVNKNLEAANQKQARTIKVLKVISGGLVIAIIAILI